MTFQNFTNLVDRYHTHHPSKRYGQAIMAVLYSVRPDLYYQTQGENLDVFNTTDHGEIKLMLVWLEQQLDNIVI